MDTKRILAELHGERARIDQAIRALEAITSDGTARLAATKTGPRTMSAAARARISAAQKARWAQQKGNKAAPNPKRAQARKPRPRMSAAARKRLSEMLKRRWTEGKMAKRKKAKAAQ